MSASSDLLTAEGARPLSAVEATYRGFACPQEGLHEEFFTLLANQINGQLARLFIERHGAQLRLRGHGLVEVLDRWIAGAAVAGIVADPAFGEVFRAVQSADPGDVAPPAAAIALQLGCAGLPGRWNVALGGAVRLRWGDWLLPPADHIDVSCDGATAHIRTRLAQTEREARLAWTHAGWQGQGAERLPRFGVPDRSITLLPRSALMLAEFDDLTAAAVETIEPGMVAIFQEAAELLRAHAPIYVDWVRRAVRHVFLIRPKQKDLESGSIEHYFGFIGVSAYPRPAAVAELLVHEASHQYFNLLCRLDPFDDGTDSTLYYSPAVRRERPLSRIGVAYHAFANILLFYRLCLESGIADGGYCAHHYAKLVPDVEQLEQPLRGNPALTAAGRALCQPLIERLG